MDIVVATSLKHRSWLRRTKGMRRADRGVAPYSAEPLHVDGLRVAAEYGPSALFRPCMGLFKSSGFFDLRLLLFVRFLVFALAWRSLGWRRAHSSPCPSRR